MNAHTLRATALAGLLAASALLSVTPLSAQHERAQDPPLFIAIPQSFPDVEARVVVMREPGRDIVVLHPEEAEPEALQVALEVLERMHREHPRPDGRAQLVPITGFVYRGAMDPERRAALESVLDALGRRPLADVGNLGLGRWMAYPAQ